MSFPLRLLQLLCERRASIIESVPKFLTSLETCSTVAAASSAQHSRPQIYHLDTKYGLQICFENDQMKTVRIIHSPAQPEIGSPITNTHTTIVDNDVPFPPQTPKAHYNYRLFPDWQTSYLWYKTSQNALADCHVHVDESDISSRYPELQDYYFAWQDIYESAFEKQGSHLGAQANVFPDVHERAAWEVEGCLIACWLALREDVEGVEYRPEEKAYLLKADAVVDVLEEFLKAVDIELG